jgi:hypothetical protein
MDLFREKEAEERKTPEEIERDALNAANRQKVEDDENKKKRNINNIFAKSQIEALNELKQDQSLKSALQILVKNFTFILPDTKGGNKGIIFAGRYGTDTWDYYYDTLTAKSRQDYTSEFITYSSILNNTGDLYKKQNDRPNNIFSKSSSVALHASTRDILQGRINEINANEGIYKSVSDKFLELWKQRFKENMAVAQYDESEQTDDKFSSLLKSEILFFLPPKASKSDYLFNLVIMYLFPIELKYAPVPLVYGLKGEHGDRICEECVGMLDDNYSKALEESAYRRENALKFKQSPNSAVGGRRTKRRKQKKKKTNKMMRIKQNTKMNKQRRTYRRRR